MKTRGLILVALAVTLTGCRLFHLGTGPSPADTITYEVARPAGDTSTGTVTIIMATPSSTTNATSTLATPFLSPAVSGFSQFTDNKPAVTVIGYGCFDAFVFKNADKIAEAHKCGQPVTFTAK